MRAQTVFQEEEDCQIFQKQSEQRMNYISYIRTDLENKESYARGKARDLTVINKRKKALLSLEQKFKDHGKTFREHHLPEGEDTGRHFNKLMTEAGSFCDAMIPNISKIKNEDNKRRLDFLTMMKNYKEYSELNTEKWHTDQKYLQIKEELIQMQQDQKLPDYCKFCLINNKETLKRMNRSNQEIKETRLLYNLKDNYSPQQLKHLMEKILRKYQRLKQNQELVPNGQGWRLITKQSRMRKNEDRQLIKEHLMEKKQPSLTAQLRKANTQFIKRLHENKKRMACYKETISQNQVIQNYQKRIYNSQSDPNINAKVEKPVINDQFQQYKEKLNQFKENAKSDLYILSHMHKKNYGQFLESRLICQQ